MHIERGSGGGGGGYNASRSVIKMKNAFTQKSVKSYSCVRAFDARARAYVSSNEKGVAR